MTKSLSQNQVGGIQRSGISAQPDSFGTGSKPSVSRQHSESSRQRPQWILGVDGGGTKTVAWLARCSSSGQPEVVGRGLAASCNMRAVGREKAEASLNAAIDAAWKEADIECCPVGSAVLALAGSSSTEVQDQIAAWAEQRSLAKRLEIVHDAKAVLKAGTPEGWGIALVAGTGAVAFGQNSGLATAVSGGWGYWFGDEGSAFGLGQSVLRAASQAADGRGPATQLLPVIIEHLGIDDPRKMLSALAHSGDVRQAIAELAKHVTTTAQEKDPVACQIIAQAGQDLAKLVESVVKQLSLENDFPLALAGGVICGSSMVRESFLQGLNEAKLKPTSVQLISDPVAGCLKMAYAGLVPS